MIQERKTPPVGDPQDIILWPNGHWEFRENVAEHELLDPNFYEVVPVGTPRWSAIKDA